jgi:hypothetical protein
MDSTLFLSTLVIAGAFDYLVNDQSGALLIANLLKLLITRSNYGEG